MAEKTCSGCEYFHPEGRKRNPRTASGYEGECHFNPPTNDGWPTVEPDNSCGHWKEKE